MKTIVLWAALSSALLPSLAYSQAKPAAPAASSPSSAACSGLSAHYDSVAKRLARVTASSISEDSAARQTNHNLDELVAQVEANSLIQLMAANKCAAPKGLPDPSPYMDEAMACQEKQARYRISTTLGSATEAQADEAIKICDIKTWSK